MRNLTLILGLISVMLFSCGPKPGKSMAKATQDIDAYVAQVDGNSDLTKETTEGALTDTEGFKDIGNFKYTVYFDDRTNTLYKIENIEMTDHSISETYYFDDGKLVFLTVDQDGKRRNVYLHNNKVLSGFDTNVNAQRLLLDKAKRFQKNFRQEH